MQSSTWSPGLHSSIVHILRDYKEVPVDFLAERLGRSRKEIEDALLTLQSEGIVSRDADIISLSRQTKGR